MRDIFLRPAEMFFSLRRRFARNSVATGAGYVTASQILRLVLLLISSSIVLRHFGPANYGVIAVAQAFFETTLNLQLQVGQAVQTFVPQLLAAGRPGAVRAVLWSGYLMRVIVFLLLGFLLTAVSPLLGGFYGDPQVGALLAILGVNAFTRTVAGPIDLNTMFALNRYRSVFIINCIDIAGALIAAIVTEVFDFSPAGYLWALLISMLPLYIYCWAQYSGIGHDLDWLRPDASDETAREWFVKLFRFGLPVSVSAFLYQASLNISILSGRCDRPVRLCRQYCTAWLGPYFQYRNSPAFLFCKSPRAW
jgi:O-antigen/teichoic acid export membrane protein